MTNRFHKSERLCSLYLIDKLFEPGSSSSIVAFPLRMVYRIVGTQKSRDSGVKESRNQGTQESRNQGTQEPTVKILISVPKRQFQHAVDRNKVKRQVREAYRTHKTLIKKNAHIAFIWLDNKHHPSSEVTAKVHNLLTRLSEKIKL